ncbi:MAG: glycosyltransferase family 1 protein, partial [Candidatus Electrothrix sp. ATG2]|nr:glycosyltransferase family 1 protein [Candidatus Electrothrix sp. ATG2]
KPNLKRESKKDRLCFIGRLAPEKNLSSLLHAVEGLEVNLDIIGEGPLRKDLQEQAAGCDHIRFHGRIAHRQLPGFLQRSTAFVFPSLYEGHPKTPIEAMACGLPVIATDVSGTKEIIQHNKTGWLCDTSTASLRKGIKTVLSDQSLRSRLGSAARKFVKDHFSLNHIVEQELTLYQSLLEKKHA